MRLWTERGPFAPQRVDWQTKLQSQKLVYGNIQNFGKSRQFVVGHKASADLDSANAVSFDQNAFYLQASSQI